MLTRLRHGALNEMLERFYKGKVIKLPKYPRAANCYNRRLEKEPEQYFILAIIELSQYVDELEGMAEYLGRHMQRKCCYIPEEYFDMETFRSILLSAI